MMNKTSSIVLQKAEEGLRGQHNHSQCSTSSSEVSSPEIPSILPHNKNTIKSANKPSSNLLVTYLENVFIAVSLSLFFVFITVLTLFVHFIVTCKIIIHRLRQPRRTTRINTASGSLEEEEEEILNFCSFGFRLTQGDLKNLSSFSYGNFEAPQDCIVCLESLREGEICRSLPKCKHNFHADCVDSWLIRVPSCPMCREIVVKPEVHTTRKLVISNYLLSNCYWWNPFANYLLQLKVVLAARNLKPPNSSNWSGWKPLAKQL